MIRVTEELNALSNKTHLNLLEDVKEHPGVFIHASIPCTAWSAWQRRKAHVLDDEVRRKLNAKRKESRILLSKFIVIADRIVTFGGHVSFEWPRKRAGWALIT